MIRSFVLFLTVVLFPVMALAKPTIAILDFDIEKNAIVITENFIATGTVEGQTKLLSSELITFLVNTRKFDVIERDHINSVLKEQEFNASGMVDTQHAIELGKLIGTDYLIMGRIEVIRAERKTKEIPYSDYVKHSTSGDMIINMRIIETLTGKIVSAKKVKTHKVLGGKQSGEVFFDEMKEMAVRQLVVEVVDGVFPIKVVGSAGGSVFLNRGEGAANFTVGQQLDVYQVGEELIDPDTGESIGKMETKIAEIIISSIQAKKSVAKISNLSGTEVPVGSVCRKPQTLLSSGDTTDKSGTVPAQQNATKPKW